MIGKTLSHYRIVEKLGEGGMGVVYKAEDTKLKRAVALKFLPPELMRDPDAKERFVQEAQAAAALDHPDICTIHEIDEAEGFTFISMAYVDGERLKDRIEHGPLTLEEALDIAVHVARGLQAAHEKGIIHRDIKSANVMLTPSGQIKIMDFGLAKVPGGTQLTTLRTTLGTAVYMSPEQAKGDPVDHRTDLWSLGVVLFEMLTGRAPFKGEYEQAIIYQILNAIPPAITSLRTGAPVELERIVNKCLEKNRDERYQTAADLIADLRRLQRTMGAGIEVTERSMTAASGGRRNRWLFWAAPMTVIALVAVALLIKTPWRTAVPKDGFAHRKEATPQEKSIAVLPFVDMSPQKDQEYFCDGITEDLINRLSNVRDLKVPARTSAFMFKGKTQDIKDIGEKLKVRTVLGGSVQKSGDRLRITAQLINVADGYNIWSEKYDRKLEDVFAIQDEISSAIVSALQLELTPQETERLSEHPIDNVRAYECYLKSLRQVGRFDEKSIDSALVYLQTAIDIMGDNAQLYAGMANAYQMYANIGIGQEEYIERAQEYAKKSLALDPNSSSALMVLGLLSIYGDYPGSIHDQFRYFKKALAASPSETFCLRPLAISYTQIGRPSEAFVLAERLERHDPLNPWRYLTRGICLLYDCQFGPAEEQLRIYYETDPTSPQTQDLYSWALACNGKHDEALAVVNLMEAATAQNVQTAFALLWKYAFLKDRKSALRVMTPEFQRTCRRDFEWSYHVAARLSLLGAKEEALDWLENAVHRGFINYPFIQCDPFLNNIRGEERFKRLMAWAKNEWEHFEVPE